MPPSSDPASFIWDPPQPIHAAAASGTSVCARLGRGDIIGLYLPMIPESFAAFYAILKIGGIVLPLFSGFGPRPIQVRLNDCFMRHSAIAA